ncbi:MAG TPA: hydantoinase B/oxoprolinase family protein, partial [Candidatus Limnocylindria bacterium]|nr:hydantoinase B/oxoprolinase family protein [Candidatus Limnocylindria bacterium]
VDAMFGALAQIVPDRVPAAGEGGNTVLSIGGYREDRTPFIIVDMICGAWGGRPGKDGIEAVTNPSQNMSNTPVEILEAQHPIRIEEYALMPDSCGMGTYRGGLGIAREYRLLNAEATLQLRSDRMKFRPYGLAGGDAAPPTRNILVRDGEPPREMPAKFAITLRRGDVIRHEQPGGGGHGDPARRAAALIEADVRNEKVSAGYARGEGAR